MHVIYTLPTKANYRFLNTYLKTQADILSISVSEFLELVYISKRFVNKLIRAKVLVLDIKNSTPAEHARCLALLSLDFKPSCLVILGPRDFNFTNLEIKTVKILPALKYFKYRKLQKPAIVHSALAFFENYLYI